jgi:hypothetical protein
LGLTPSTSYQFQLVAFRGTLNVNAVFGGLSNVANATTAASAVLPVAAVTVGPASGSVLMGQMVQLIATPKDSAGNLLLGRVITWSSSNTAVATVGGGLVIAAAPGSATITATSEGKSGTAAITVTVPPPSGGVVFQSNWTTALGFSNAAVMDGARWDSHAEFGGGALLSVVAGGPSGYANALQVQQRGTAYAAQVQKTNVLPPGTDFYVRYYMRNDDTSPSGDHVVTCEYSHYYSLTYMRKSSSAAGWQFVIGVFYSAPYPVGYWGPAQTLSHGVWYRLEYYVHWTDATHIQVHPRVYDAAGTLILSDANFLQTDYGAASWNGRSDWTLASYYAAGYNFGVDSPWVPYFAMGNNSQSGSVDTGLFWYYAGVQIRTDTWPGP